MQPTIYIRTDGNSEIATGHLVRCLSIARALQKEACEIPSFRVQFLVSSKESRELLKQFFDTPSEFSIKILNHADFRNPERELDEMLLLGNAMRPLLLLDSYFVTPTYLQSLKSVFTTVYIDDLRAFDYPVDVIINYDLLTPSERNSCEDFYHSAKKKLLGGSYTPLRPQFWNCSFKDHASGTSKLDTTHLLISSGGSDPYHTTLRLTLHLLQTFPKGYCLHVLIGAYNPDRDDLYRLAENHPVILHEHVSQMAALMDSCDLAISAAGTTLYELCAVGVPAASFVLADNQLSCARAFEECHLIPCLGDVRTAGDEVMKKATAWVASCPPPYDPMQSDRMPSGSGALHIARDLLSLF